METLLQITPQDKKALFVTRVMTRSCVLTWGAEGGVSWVIVWLPPQRKGYAMDESTVKALEKPGEDEKDTLTPLLREGARRMLAQAIEAEVEAFVAAHEHIKDEAGRRVVIRNGYLPKRTVQTGIGDIAVEAPRVRDLSGSGRVGHSVYLRDSACRWPKSVSTFRWQRIDVDRPLSTWAIRGVGAVLKTRRTLCVCCPKGLAHPHRERAYGRKCGNNPCRLIRREAAPSRDFNPQTGRREHYHFSSARGRKSVNERRANVPVSLPPVVSSPNGAGRQPGPRCGRAAR